MSPQSITAATTLSNIEQSFRLRAGPGAGKTTWLVGHVHHLCRTSRRLGPARRIACISYTEIAAAQIISRLSPNVDQVDVSTIHSFLYRNVVKPYLHLLTDDGIPIVASAQVDGHNEHRPSVSQFMRKCVTASDRAELNRRIYAKAGANKGKGAQFQDAGYRLSGGTIERGDDDVYRCLSNLSWKLGDGGWTLEATLDHPRLTLDKTALRKYKELFWAKGEIHHDDVLYFAHRLLSSQPILRDFLSARYPYILVDEFQDTTRAQTEILKWLADCGSVVGLIGDPEQAIFEFNGATPSDFETVYLPNMVEYEIPGNHRSTAAIVTVLNHVRRDPLKQIAQRAEAAPAVRLYVGAKEHVLQRVAQVGGPENAYVALFRKRKDVALLRLRTGVQEPDHWVSFNAADSDYGRRRFIRGLAEACAMMKSTDYAQAARALTAGMRHAARADKIDLSTRSLSAIAISLLEYFVKAQDTLDGKNLIDIYKDVRSIAMAVDPKVKQALPAIREGNSEDCRYKSGFFDALVRSVDITDEKSPVRTVHKAKGAEFDTVFVWLEKRMLEAVLNGDESDEERRVVYVALSRAKNQLFLGTAAPPTTAGRRVLESLAIQIEQIPSPDVKPGPSPQQLSLLT